MDFRYRGIFVMKKEDFYKLGVTQKRDFVEIDFVESLPYSLLDIQKTFIKRI